MNYKNPRIKKNFPLPVPTVCDKRFDYWQMFWCLKGSPHFHTQNQGFDSLFYKFCNSSFNRQNPAVKYHCTRGGECSETEQTTGGWQLKQPA